MGLASPDLGHFIKYWKEEDDSASSDDEGHEEDEEDEGHEEDEEIKTIRNPKRKKCKICSSDLFET